MSNLKELSMIKWLKFMWHTRACPHARLEGVYGDQINAVGGRRLHCLDCLRYLNGPVSLANTPIDRKLMDAYNAQRKLHDL